MFNDKVIIFHTEDLRGGYDMENSPPSEHSVVVGRHNHWRSVRNGIGVDDEWECQ